MSRVLFANPFRLAASALEQEWQTPYPPLGLLYVAASARRAGHEVAFYDATFETDHAAFDAHLETFQPDFVCLGSLVTLRAAACALAARARDAGACVIAGGPDPTAEPDAYLGDIDVVIRGEAEGAIVSVLSTSCSRPELASIAGIAFRSEAGRVVLTPNRAVLADLDTLALPARDLVDMERYTQAWRRAHGYASLAIAASRGCALDCEYCRTIKPGSHFRVRSPAAVAAEMRALQDEYHPERFRLVDDLDGLGAAWLRQLAAAMHAHGVTVPYEGLRLHENLGDLPMLARTKELCAERNAWLPKAAAHPHAPSSLDHDTLAARWERAYLEPGATLAEP